MTHYTHTKFGAPQNCPKCGGQNESGRKLPEECRWCDTDLINDNHLKRVLPERYEMLQSAWAYWKTMSVHDHAKHIVYNRDYTPGIDDDILLVRIRELER